MAEPIADLQWGKVNWNDYEHNWREKDAEFLQSRTILRFHNDTERNAGVPSGSWGSVVYNEASDKLEWRKKAGGTGAWEQILPMPQFLAVPTDTAASVVLAHSGASSKGIAFNPADVKVTHDLDVLGVLKVAAAGVTVKTGGATAAITTDATDLVSSVPLKVPSLTLTGTGTVLSAPGKTIAVGTVTADQVSAASLSLSGTLTGGIINGTAGTIGGVALNTNAAAAPSGFYAGTGGGVGLYTSDATKAVIQSRSGPGTFRAGKIEVDDNVGLFGTLVNLNSDMAVRNKTIKYYDAGNTVRGLGYAVSVYSATDPGVANFPEGAIWFS